MIVCNQTAHFLLIEIYHVVLKGRFAGRVNGALVSVEQFGLLFGIKIHVMRSATKCGNETLWVIPSTPIGLFLDIC